MNCPHCHNTGVIARGSIEADICGCRDESLEEDDMRDASIASRPWSEAYQEVIAKRLANVNDAFAEIQRNQKR